MGTASVEFAVETCDSLHKFAFIVGEPKPRCPYCLATGLDQARQEVEQLRRGEFICQRCHLRKDAEFEEADF